MSKSGIVATWDEEEAEAGAGAALHGDVMKDDVTEVDRAAKLARVQARIAVLSANVLVAEAQRATAQTRLDALDVEFVAAREEEDAILCDGRPRCRSWHRFEPEEPGRDPYWQGCDLYADHEEPHNNGLKGDEALTWTVSHDAPATGDAS